MKWCSHCMKSVNNDCVIGTECTFWSCVDCGKILGSVCMIGWGQKRRLERARRTPKKTAKETIVRTTKSSSVEGDGAENICLIGSVKKRRLKGARRTITRTTEAMLQINKKKISTSYDTHVKLFSSPLEWSSTKFNLQGYDLR